MQDSREQFGIQTVVLHWLVAASVIGMIVIGISVENMQPSAEKWRLLDIHISMGLAVLCLAGWRLARRVRFGLPQELGSARPLQRKAAIGVHSILLIATILMPVSGLAGAIAGAHPVRFLGITIIPQFLAHESKAISDISEGIHGVVGNLLIPVIVLHILAALWHQFVYRDGTMSRMLGLRVPCRNDPLDPR